MSQVELAKRYAKALLQLGHQKEKSKEYANQLKGVAAAFTSQADVFSFFSNTTVGADLKKKSFEALFQGGQYAEDVKAFLFLLIDRSRIYALPEIVRAYEQLLDEEEGVTRGKIKSATPVSEQAKQSYEKKLGTALGKKIYLDTAIDEKVMGGVRVEVGGWTFDDSIETHLHQLNDQLLKIRN